jgi:hypothetical protein
MRSVVQKLSSNQRASAVALTFTVVTLLVAMLISSAAQEVSYRHKCAQVKENLHAIQLAVERYSVDDPNSSYPRDIREIIRRGYLEQFPINPFTGLPMRCVEQSSSADNRFEHERVPEQTELGDFMYFKRYGPRGRQSNNEAPQGYSLAAYM